MGKIIHGNKSFGYAPISKNGNVIAFGTPVMLAGLVNTSIEVEQDETKIYADNQVFASVKGAKARNIKVALRYISEEYAQFLGYIKNANGMLSDGGEYPNHCIFFESEEMDTSGTTTRTLHYLYNVTAKAPTKETVTDEESVEAQELSVEYTGNYSEFVVDDEGNYVQYGYITRNESNAKLYDKFTEEVILPTSPIPTTNEKSK